MQCVYPIRPPIFVFIEQAIERREGERKREQEEKKRDNAGEEENRVSAVTASNNTYEYVLQNGFLSTYHYV